MKRDRRRARAWLRRAARLGPLHDTAAEARQALAEMRASKSR